MKGWILSGILILATVWYVATYGVPGSEAEKIMSALRDMGINRAYVSVSSGSATIRFEAPVLNENTANLAYSVAKIAMRSADVNRVRAEAYFEGTPIVAVTVEGGHEESPTLEDIRPAEKRIEAVVGLFDTIPLDVNVGEDEVHVTVQYYGKENEFWKNFFGMTFGMLTEAPWVERIAATYVGDENTTITIDANTVLDIYAGKTDMETTVQHIQIQ